MGIAEVDQYPRIKEFCEVDPAEFLKKEVQIKYNKLLVEKLADPDRYQEKIDHMEINCVDHFGMSTADVKVWGKKVGLKASRRTSARAVFRVLYPEISASMSLVDLVVSEQYLDTKRAVMVSKKYCIPVFRDILGDFTPDKKDFRKMKKAEFEEKLLEIEKMRPK